MEKKQFTQPILDHVHEEVDAAYAHVKSAIGLILEGGFYSNEEVKRMTGPVGDKGFKRCCTLFFSAVACLKKVQAAGLLCSAEDRNFCESKILGVLKWWQKDIMELYEKWGVEGALKEMVD